jgi:hypothetical protein
VRQFLRLHLDFTPSAPLQFYIFRRPRPYRGSTLQSHLSFAASNRSIAFHPLARGDAVRESQSMMMKPVPKAVDFGLDYRVS